MTCLRPSRQVINARRWAELHDESLFSSDLLRTEALRAARRHSPKAVLETRSRLDAVTIISVTTGISERAADDISERAAELDPQIMCSLDALHLAAALAVGDDLGGIATYDDSMSEAAASLGVPVVAPSR